ncbi:MAG: Hsp20/alpha crystallin family protein [Deltaproteobacteria bacterium]|nr:Hsp20/alpha crystallin family protein [Deltaproteobacteria bacterium]
MAIWKWGPPPGFGNTFQEVERLHNEMNRLWERVSGARTAPDTRPVFPPVIVSEDDDYYYVRAEMPGVETKQLDLSVVNDQLILRGERKTAREGEKINYHRREREEGIFRRVIALPSRVNNERVEARTRNGILTIKLAKAEEVKPRPVEIQVEP